MPSHFLPPHYHYLSQLGIGNRNVETDEWPLHLVQTKSGSQWGTRGHHSTLRHLLGTCPSPLPLPIFNSFWKWVFACFLYFGCRYLFFVACCLLLCFIRFGECRYFACFGEVWRLPVFLCKIVIVWKQQYFLRCPNVPLDLKRLGNPWISTLLDDTGPVLMLLRVGFVPATLV